MSEPPDGVWITYYDSEIEDRTEIEAVWATEIDALRAANTYPFTRAMLLPYGVQLFEALKAPSRLPEELKKKDAS